MPIRIYGAAGDQFLKEELEKHLTPMKREGLIAAVHDALESTRNNKETSINLEEIQKCDIILLLISVDFLASDDCMHMASQAMNAKGAIVIPIILRACAWESALFGKLQVLPENRIPIAEWESLDEAFVEVYSGIRSVVTSVLKKQREALYAIVGAGVVTTAAAGLGLKWIFEKAQTSIKGAWEKHKKSKKQQKKE